MAGYLRALASAVVVAAVACDVATLPPAPGASGASPTVAVDCGSFDAGHDRYDAQGLDCFWTAYSAGKSARWTVKQLTIEGDPILSTIASDASGTVVVSRDFSADRFSSPADRRVLVWTCATVARKPWPTDRSREYLELAGCTGEGTSASFP